MGSSDPLGLGVDCPFPSFASIREIRVKSPGLKNRLQRPAGLAVDRPFPSFVFIREIHVWLLPIFPLQLLFARGVSNAILNP